jgi:hypothetical protein
LFLAHWVEWDGWDGFFHTQDLGGAEMKDVAPTVGEYAPDRKATPFGIDAG